MYKHKIRRKNKPRLEGLSLFQQKALSPGLGPTLPTGSCAGTCADAHAGAHAGVRAGVRAGVPAGARAGVPALSMYSNPLSACFSYILLNISDCLIGRRWKSAICDRDCIDGLSDFILAFNQDSILTYLCDAYKCTPKFK